MLIGNPIGSLVIAYIKNPLYFLYTGLGVLVMLLSYERSFSEKPVEAGFFSGKIVWDQDKPDGTPRKVLDTTKIKNLGWKPSITLDVGIRATIDWYLSSTSK